MADFCFFDIFAARHRHQHLVRAFDAVGNDAVYAGLERVEAVLIGAVEMVERILAPADVERVAVGEERLAAQLLDDIADRLGIVRAQEREIARFAEMDFHRDIFPGKVDLVDARRAAEPLQFLRQPIAELCTHVCKVNLGCFHAIHLIAVIYFDYTTSRCVPQQKKSHINVGFFSVYVYLTRRADRRRFAQSLNAPVENDCFSPALFCRYTARNICRAGRAARRACRAR